MSIRLASPDDAIAVAAVLLDAFREYEHLYTAEGFRATTPDADAVRRRMVEGPTWIADHEGGVIGTVSAILSDNEVHIRGMAVLPDGRGIGVASMLLGAVHEFATMHRVQRLTLKTTPFLNAAIAFYMKAGFRKNGETSDLHGTPLFSMARDITPV